MIDCSRHFFSVEVLKKHLKMMAFYKMNRFHWHLTDDQGWRLEIKKYPALTEVGSRREGTQVGKKRNTCDGIPYGGFYTQEQVRDIVQYADSLCISIVPEIDFPGHFLAALASYPELGCSGSAPYKVGTGWGISRQVMNPGKESAVRFIEDVLAEVSELFPGEYIHIGGDECPRDEWKTDPDCQARIETLGLASQPGRTAEDGLQSYLTDRICRFLKARGKRAIGWEEAMSSAAGQDLTIMAWKGMRKGIEAARSGMDVIMTPNNHCYFNYYQLSDRSAQEAGCAKVVPFSSVYGFDPLSGLGSEEIPYVKGVQANLWSEYIPTERILDYLLFPRLFALCELQWSQSGTRSCTRLESAAGFHRAAVLAPGGFHYCDKTE